MFNVVCSAEEVTLNKIDPTLAGYLYILNETT